MNEKDNQIDDAPTERRNAHMNHTIRELKFNDVVRPWMRHARLVSVEEFQTTRRLEIAPSQVVPALDAGFDVIFASVKINGAEMQSYAIASPAPAGTSEAGDEARQERR